MVNLKVEQMIKTILTHYF